MYHWVLHFFSHMSLRECLLYNSNNQIGWWKFIFLLAQRYWWINKMSWRCASAVFFLIRPLNSEIYLIQIEVIFSSIDTYISVIYIDQWYEVSTNCEGNSLHELNRLWPGIRHALWITTSWKAYTMLSNFLIYGFRLTLAK